MVFIKKQNSKPKTNYERRQARDFKSLLSELESPDAMDRRWAARDLADCQDASTALVWRLNREEDQSVREVILSSLANLCDPVAVAGLVACLRCEDAPMRNEAIEVMKQMPDSVGPIMTNLLVDDDADVRIFAVNILESLRHPDVVTWLIDVIQRDTNLNVCATAVDLLVEVGAKSSEPALHALKIRFVDEPYIQFAVDLALKRIAEN